MQCPWTTIEPTRLAKINIPTSLMVVVTFVYQHKHLVMELNIEGFLYNIQWLVDELKYTCFAEQVNLNGHYKAHIWNCDFPWDCLIPCFNALYKTIHWFIHGRNWFSSTQTRSNIVSNHVYLKMCNTLNMLIQSYG